MIQSIDRIINRSAFPTIQNVDAELKKIAILRIVLGIVIFVRYLEIVTTLLILKESIELVYFGLFFLGLIVLFTIGLLTNLATLLLICLSIFFDTKVGTYTLGTDIYVLLLVPFLLINSSQRYSIDKWMIKKNTWIYKPVLEVASWFGTRNPEIILRYYFLCFVLYAVVSFGALLLHIQDDFWIHGLTTKSLLLNSYLCKHYDWFRWIDLNVPGLLSILSISATIFQSVFQFLMIPLIFFKTGRRFVFLWGMSFFIISFFCINLSYLPHIEIIYWLMVLSPAKTFGGDFSTKRINETASHSEKIPATGITEIDIAKDIFFRNQGLRKFLSDKIVLVYWMFIFGYFLFRCPYTKNITNWVPGLQAKANKVLFYAGFDVPNVFNKTDLSMGDTWMEIYRKEEGKWIFTSLTGKDGERSNYSGFDIMHFSNHNSDLLYFGTTLRFRRKILYQDLKKCLEPNEVCGEGLRRLLRYDYLVNELDGNVEYKIVVRRNKTSQVTHAKGEVNQYKAELILKRVYSCNGVNVLQQ